MTASEQRAYERGYADGRRRSLINATQEAAKLLEAGIPQAVIAELQTERLEAVAILRDACERYGDNDWEDDLHLTDILDKHLMPHLKSKEENKE